MSSSVSGNWSGRTNLKLNAHGLGEGGTQAVRNYIIPLFSCIVKCIPIQTSGKQVLKICFHQMLLTFTMPAGIALAATFLVDHGSLTAFRT